MEAFKESLSTESEKNKFVSFVACVEGLLQQEEDKLSEEQVFKVKESLVNYYKSHSGLDVTKPAVVSGISKYLSSVLEEIKVEKPKEEKNLDIDKSNMKLNLAGLQTIENFDGEGSFP
uniref:SGT2 n=1 Tax=Strongyloides venezuelensis TaxID=75913 RepID=A0A0K0FJ52_STRVS